MKVCTKCNLEQPLENYYTYGKEGKRHGSCKTCFKNKAKESKERLGDDHNKDYMLRYTYGITLEQYNSLPQECGICGRNDHDGRGLKLSVDHCHTTGKVRGLLCNSCNRGLGLLGEDNLEASIRYLERSRQLELSQQTPGREGNYVRSSRA